MMVLKKITRKLALALLALCWTTIVFGQPTPEIPTSFVAITNNATTIDLSWNAPATGYTPDGYLIAARKSGGTFPTVTDGVFVPDDFDFTDGNQNGAANIVATSYSWTGLDPETEYFFRAFSFNNADPGSPPGALPQYRTTGAPTSSAWTLSLEPGAHPSTFTASVASASQINLAFDAASTLSNADGYIILRSPSGTPTIDGINDGTSPNSLVLPGGTSLVTITNDSDVSYNDIDLNASTTYYYLIIPFNYNGADNETYNYKTDSAPLNDNAATTTATVTLTQELNSIAPNPLSSGANNQALLGFNLIADANGTTFTGITVHVTSDPSVSLTNVRIYHSTNSNFTTFDNDLGGTIIITPTEIQITGISQPIGTIDDFYFFIVADIASTVSSSTPNLQLSLDESDLTLNSNVTAATITGTDYSFEDVLTPTVTFSPLQGSVNIPINTTMTITFSEAVRNLDDSPISNADLQTLVELKETNNSGLAIGFTASINITNTVITITPNANLNGNQLYFLEMNLVEDFSDNSIVTSQNITFTTELPPNITTLSPSGETCVGETITINGSNFVSPTVTINGISAPITSSNSNQIQITAPGGAAVGSFPIVVTNGSGLSDNSASYEIKQINLGMPVSSSNNNPATGQSFNILVGGASQSGITYRVGQTSPLPAGPLPGTQNGNGGQLSFPITRNFAGVYEFRVYASSTNCTGEQELSQIVIVNIAQLSAEAGPTAVDICDGDSIILGGSPTASGGSGFYNITWSSNPPGYASTETNPSVKPTVPTTYTVTVTDSDGTIETDDIFVDVKAITDPADLDINFNPNKTSYSIDEPPVTLSFTVSGGAPGTGTFYGPGVNTNSSQFYPNAADLGSNTIELVFINTDNCASSITESVNVYDPNGFIGGLEPLYCPVGTDNLTVNVNYPYLSLVDVNLLDPTNAYIPPGSGWTKNIASRQLFINLTQLPIGVSQFEINYIYETTIKILGISVPVQLPTTVFVPLNIKEPPVAEITLRSPDALFCKNENPVEAGGSPIGGIWQAPAGGLTPAVGNDSDPAFSPGDNGMAQFDPNSASVGNNNIRYIFEDDNGCRDTTTTTLTVYNIPTIDFVVGNGCVGVPVAFTPSVNTPPSVTITEFLWDYDDDQREIFIIPQNPTYHTYQNSNDYDVTFYAQTTDLCVVSTTHSLSVGDIPDIKLSWQNVCENDPTRFTITSSFFGYSPSDVSQFTWDFGDGAVNIITTNNPTPADLTEDHLYTSNGYFTAAAQITTDLGCTNSDTIDIYKVYRTLPINDDNEYLEDFNTNTFDEQGWVTGGQNTSWDWGFPTGTYIDDDIPGGGKAWVTNLNGSSNSNEKSWVHSPCFNLTEIERPILSLDLRSLTRKQIEGVVLQMNTTNSTDNDNDWKTVEGVGSGVNWYDAIGILSNPGNQPLLQTGWSQYIDTMAWRSAVISLDNTLSSVVNKTRVRFRMAFASPSTSGAGFSPEGFAFDNFRIDQRDRISLVESFTHNGGENTANEPNKVANQAINTFTQSLENELVKIEYHLNLGGPNADPIYLDNSVDANARAGYYGVTSTPIAFVDAQTGSSLPNVFSDQTLKPAAVTIDTIFTKADPANKLNIEVSFTTKEDLPANTVLHIVVVEKTIDAPEALGNNGETLFHYVMKKMLPNALGTRYTTALTSGTTDTVNVSWTPLVYDVNNLAIIAFLQHEESKEVYQARILKNPVNLPDLSLITSVETPWEEQIRIFPNPSDRAFTLSLPPQASSQPMTLKVINALGTTVLYDELAVGIGQKVVDTQSIPSGSYFLQLEGVQNILVRKKMIILHK